MEDDEREKQFARIEGSAMEILLRNGVGREEEEGRSEVGEERVFISDWAGEGCVRLPQLATTPHCTSRESSPESREGSRSGR